MGLWIQSGNKNVVFTMGWKKFAKTKKGVAGWVKRESHVDGVLFLTSRALCITEFLHQRQTVNHLYLRENVMTKQLQLWENNKAHSVAGVSKRIIKKIVQNFLNRPCTYNSALHDSNLILIGKVLTKIYQKMLYIS
jgi:hypothetical protein